MTRAIDLVCLGRAGVDVRCLPDGGEEHQLGGMAARTSPAGSPLQPPPQQFRPASAMTMRAVVRRAFEHTGVDITAVQVDVEHETTRLRIDVRAGTRRLAVANETAADLFLGPGHTDRELIACARLLQITGTVLAAAKHAAKSGAPVVLDLVVRPGCWPDGPETLAGVVETIAASWTPVVGTEDELEIATDLPPDAAAKTLRRWGGTK